jgi:hypothetical protein
MHPLNRLVGILIVAATSARAQNLPVGPVLLSLRADQVETMKQIKAHFEVVTVTGQPDTFFLYEGKRPNLRVVGGVAFQSGRVSWVQRTWGNFEGKTSAVDVSGALYSAIESATSASGASATITTKVHRVPGIEFKTVTFDFSDRRVTMTTSEGDAAHGGKQVGIDESIRLLQ